MYVVLSLTAGLPARAAAAELPDGLVVAEAQGASAFEEVVAGEYIVRVRAADRGALRVDRGALVGVSPSLAGPLQAAQVRDVRPALGFAPARAVGPSAALQATFRFRSDLPLDDVQRALASAPEVESVEPLLRHRAHGDDPSDTWYHFQWAWQNLDLPAIRELGTGAGVRVAVVDSGVTPAGADSFESLLTGYDFIDDDDDASDDDALVAGLAHGTHVAGTIAQRTDNIEGVAGLASGASILPVRVLHYDAPSGVVGGFTDDIAEGIVYAVDQGAQIINLSLGTGSRSDLVADALAYAYENDVLVVCSSGNDGAAAISYPGRLPTCLSVGAVGRAHNVTAYSNYGPELVMVAPGGESDQDRDGDGHFDGIVQESITSAGWRYVFTQGTSMAAPHVSGAAALMFERGWTTPAAVQQVLVASAFDIGANGRDDESGFGELDVLGALAWPVADGLLSENGEVTISDPWVDYTTDAAWVAWFTDVASTTRLSGDGVDTQSDTLFVRAHKVRVPREPGLTTTLTLRSETSDGYSDSTKVDIHFPDELDDLFGCLEGTSLAFPGLAFGIALRRRRSARTPGGPR